MKNRSVSMNLHTFNNRGKTLLLTFGVVLSAVLFVTILFKTSPVYAAGGIGSGGSATTGPSDGSGHWSWFGFSWARYETSGDGPTDGFKTGTWANAKSTCQAANANSVYIFIVLNNGIPKTARGYNYETAYDGFWNQPTPGQYWDGGKAFTISKSTAETAFNNLGDYLPADVLDDFTFGVDVSWFCYDYAPKDGSIQTNKYFPPGEPNDGVDTKEYPAAVNNATACWTNKDGLAVVCNNSNPWKLDNVATSGNPNRISVAVPSGYRLNKTNDRPFSCTGSGNTGTCTVTDVDVTAGGITHVDFWFERHHIPNGGTGANGCDIGNFTYRLRNGEQRTTRAAIVGWTQDEDFVDTDPSGGYKDGRVHVYANAPAGSPESEFVGEYFGNKYPQTLNGVSVGNPAPFVNGGPGNPPSWHDWFVVPYDDIAQYADAYSRKFYIYHIGLDTEGNNNGLHKLPPDEVTIGDCAPPTCTTTPVDIVTNQPITPEVDQRFKVDLSITYNPGPKGRPLTQPRALFRIEEGSISTPLETFDYPYNIPTGSPRKYFMSPTGTGYVFSTPGERDLRGRIRISNLTNSNPYNANIDVFCGNEADPPTLRVTYQPYFKVFGNDVRVGGRFEGGDCSSPLAQDATIIGRARFTNDGQQYFSGASVELAAYALAEIDQFYSAGMKNPHYTSGTHNATPQNGLTFSNWPKSGTAPRGFDGQTSAAKFGGQTSGYGGESNIWRCIPNYWTHAAPYSSSAAVNVSATVNGVAKRQHPTASNQVVRVNGGELANGTKRTIFIDGDAFIDSNITYSAAPRAQLSSIPQFTVVVRGNLYISNGVNRLDGLYIALPRCPASNTGCNPDTSVAAAYNDVAAQGGKIYTCAYVDASSRGQRYAANQLYDNCRGVDGTHPDGQPLVINGAFVAKRIKLLRTNGSVIRATKASQQINFSYHGTNASAVGSGKECINVTNLGPKGANTHGDWNNNYICVDPGQLGYFELTWVNDGPSLPLTTSPSPYGPGSSDARARNNRTMRPGKICTPFFEPSEVSGFNNNYLCYRADRGVELEFHYEALQRPGAGYRCDVFDSASAGTWDGDGHTWTDNALCQPILPAGDYNEPATSTNLGEVFNFSPEMYLVTPSGFPTTSGPGVGSYDSVRTLPPLL